MFEGVMDSLPGAAQEVLGQGRNLLSNAVEAVTSIKDSTSVKGYRVEEIGKPFQFADHVDPKNRGSQFLLTRMNCVDLII